MSLLLLEGFDDGLYLNRWVLDGNAPTFPASRPGSGNGFRHAGGSGDNFIKRNLPAGDQHATLTAGFVQSVDGYAAGITATDLQRAKLAHWMGDAGTVFHVTLSIDNVGALRVWRGLSGTGTQLGATAVGLIKLNTFHYIEMLVTLSDAAGVIQLWVDNVQVLNLSGLDTKNAGAGAVFDAFSLGWEQTNPNTPIWDDFYLTNGNGAAPYNGRLGDLVIETRLPNGNGNSSGWTGSDGNSVDNYLLVDENPHNSDTDYVVSAADALLDLYTFQDLAAAAGNIRGVMASGVVRHEGVGDNYRLMTRISGANFNGAVQAAPASYAEGWEIWQLSPATANHWTVAEVNGAEFGMENRP